ncbi:MAG: DUF1403 family protein [Acidobacteriaceae bacterium]|nr:DUF1403 family protein [Acidobacteriaceae bacterium]
MAALSHSPWTRITTADPEGAAFVAGAALAAVDALLAAPLPHRGVWLDRLALQAATAAAAVLGRREDEAAIRDALSLCPGGGDPGPAGRLFVLWRRLTRRAPRLDRPALVAAAALLGVADDATLDRLLDHAGPDIAPIAAAAAVLHACQGGRPPLLVLGFWVADSLLAHRLGWSVGVPLLATSKLMARRGAPAIAPAGWSLGCRDSALAAVALAADLEHRAVFLLAQRPRLRARASALVVEKLLAQDALAASMAIPGISERGLRRLFDRLLALGAVRELSGRSTSRLYGV